MKNVIKNLKVNEEYFKTHSAVPFTLNKKTSYSKKEIYSWNTVASFFPKEMDTKETRLKYLMNNIKHVGLDDLAMPDQPKDDRLIEDCHEITLDEYLSYYKQDKAKQENTIWNIEKNYTAIFMTKETNDQLRKQLGRSVSLVYPAADCAIVRYYDKKKNVIGLTHSDGWFTGENIVGKMTNYMKNHFHSNIEDIEVYVGAFAHSDWIYNGLPSFVGTKLEDGTIKYRGEWEAYIEKLDQDKIKINYGDLLYKQVIDSGISKNNLFFSKENTLFDKDYYSHSRSINTKEKEGRNLFGISFDVENIINHKEKNGTILR